VYEGDLQQNGKSLSRVRRLTFGKGRDDFPRAWTADSKAIFFDSNRNGKWEIFKHSLDQVSDEPYWQASNDAFSPRMSADQRSLLYLDRPREWHEPDPVSLM
jgi:Tol biopolymer transport system component